MSPARGGHASPVGNHKYLEDHPSIKPESRLPAMAETQPQTKLVKLDGRTGEGGGQLCRIAVSLAALTGTPLRIDNVRGNRYVHRV